VALYKHVEDVRGYRRPLRGRGVLAVRG
jgi:hypothetical protein